MGNKIPFLLTGFIVGVLCTLAVVIYLFGGI